MGEANSRTKPVGLDSYVFDPKLAIDAVEIPNPNSRLFLIPSIPVVPLQPIDQELVKAVISAQHMCGAPRARGFSVRHPDPFSVPSVSIHALFNRSK